MNHPCQDSPLMATDVIHYLQETYGISASEARAVAQERLHYNPFPLYLRLLIGIGAVISGGLLLLFLGSTGFFDEPIGMIALGIAMVGVAIFVHLQSRDQDQAGARFVIGQQLSFLGVFAGKVLIVVGAGEQGDEVGAFVATLGFTLATYWVYDLYMDRLASCVGTLVAGIFLLTTNRHLGYASEIAILVHLLVPLGLAIYLHPRIKQTYNPLAIACLGVAAGFSLGTMLDGSTEMLGKALLLEHHVSFAGLLTVITTCCSLIALVAWACGGKSSLGSRHVIATIALTCLLGLASLTSTMIGLIVIILGYICHDRLITLVGVLFLPLTLWLAVHSLQMGLMNTGVLLVLTSLVLLAGYFAFRYWGFATATDTDSPGATGEGIPHA